jgi:hypothetical protein
MVVIIAVIVAGSALYKLITSWLIGLINTALTKSNIKADTNTVLANIFFMRLYEIVV